jgi:hypothetical protein
LPQLTPECELLIIDNCSDTPVSQTLGAIFAQYPDVNYRIIRNRTNIGGNANILRCFELCDTEWLWILADDDKSEPNAVSTILQHINSHSECLYFNFVSKNQPIARQSFTTKGLDDFIKRMDCFGLVLFCSTAVYNARAMLPNLKFGYHYAYSCAPHVATLLASIGSAEVCFFSEAQIVHWEPHPMNESWSHINLVLGITTLLELPLTSSQRKELAKKITPSSKSIQGYAGQLALMAVENGDEQDSLYIYDQICSRLYYFERSMAYRVKRFLLNGMLRYPAFCYRVLASIYRMKGIDLREITVLDRFNRF